MSEDRSIFIDGMFMWGVFALCYIGFWIYLFVQSTN